MVGEERIMFPYSFWNRPLGLGLGVGVTVMKAFGGGDLLSQYSPAGVFFTLTEQLVRVDDPLFS